MKAKLFVFFILGLATVSLSLALPAPRYLSVPNWKKCVSTTQRQTAVFICLPQMKPAQCPRSSWAVLTKERLIEACGR